MAFIETPRFPDYIALGSAGGPEYNTRITESSNALEYRKKRWSFPRHRYNVGVGAKSSAEIDTLRDFHHAMFGRFTGFRFKDFNDYSSAANMDVTVTSEDQTIGTGDGVENEFQLKKTYTVGTESMARNITKPVAGSVLVALGDAASPEVFTDQTEGVDFTVDTTTGIITFTTAPGAGSPVTTPTIKAGFQFDVPVRFDNDLLQVQQISPGVEMATINVVELIT